MKLEHLKEWRLYRGWTQAELADRADIARETISRTERGGNIRKVYARLLAMALDIHFVALTDASPPVKK